MGNEPIQDSLSKGWQWARAAVPLAVCLVAALIWTSRVQLLFYRQPVLNAYILEAAGHDLEGHIGVGSDTLFATCKTPWFSIDANFGGHLDFNVCSPDGPNHWSCELWYL